jgi:hypothetical protein
MSKFDVLSSSVCLSPGKPLPDPVIEYFKTLMKMVLVNADFAGSVGKLQNIDQAFQ